MQGITKSFFFQINNVFNIKKYLGTVIIAIILNSCTITDAAMNKIGFNVINPFWSDSNVANKQYDRKFSNHSRRTPEGNLLYLTLDNKKTANKYDTIQRDTEKFDNQRMNKFWQKVYSDPDKADFNGFSEANKIERVYTTEIPSPDGYRSHKNIHITSKNLVRDTYIKDRVDIEPKIQPQMYVEPIRIEPKTDSYPKDIEPQEPILNDENEKILNEINFLKNNNPAKTEKPKKTKKKEYKHKTTSTISNR